MNTHITKNLKMIFDYNKTKFLKFYEIIYFENILYLILILFALSLNKLSFTITMKKNFSKEI